MSTLIDKSIVDNIIVANKAQNLDSASIRRLVSVASGIEKQSGVEFIRMEIGSPGFKSPLIGVEAQKQALAKGCSAKYPVIDGLPELKNQAATFIEAFTGVKIDPRCCIPTVGAMQGVFTSFITTMTRCHEKNTVLFLDPGFALQKQQLEVLGYKYISYDIADHRGGNFEKSLRQLLEQNKISSLIYSNPNNPTWMCLTDNELEVIGRLATEYDFIVIEDLAYFCMDFRNDLSQPFREPYQTTVARYTDNYIVHISASKIFSYAGERIAIAAISPMLYDRDFKAFKERYTHSQFGTTYVYSVLYALSSGVAHSVQYALAEMFRAACEGEIDFVSQMREYGARAWRMKDIFIRHGFEITYPSDGEVSVADGFFFTISYPGMTGAELLYELLHFGISAITLQATGAERTGLRACTSDVRPYQFDDLERRLTMFVNHHKKH